MWLYVFISSSGKLDILHRLLSLLTVSGEIERDGRREGGWHVAWSGELPLCLACYIRWTRHEPTDSLSIVEGIMLDLRLKDSPYCQFPYVELIYTFGFHLCPFYFAKHKFSQCFCLHLNLDSSFPPLNPCLCFKFLIQFIKKVDEQGSVYMLIAWPRLNPWGKYWKGWLQIDGLGWVTLLILFRPTCCFISLLPICKVTWSSMK